MTKSSSLLNCQNYKLSNNGETRNFFKFKKKQQCPCLGTLLSSLECNSINFSISYVWDDFFNASS